MKIFSILGHFCKGMVIMKHTYDVYWMPVIPMIFVGRSFTILLIFNILIFSNCRNMDNNKIRKANQLINETSPYLIQHAYNPVDWYPWGEEALQIAANENKMIIISIGYAACHWCHVMERESFEDQEVAEIMNKHFISIKVDREERPDVDDIYMTACQLATGGGCGWPLNAFALSDGRPVWAGTYFPKDNWKDVLEHFIQLKSNEPDRLLTTAERLTQGISQFGRIDPPQHQSIINKEHLDTITQRMLQHVDYQYGGNKGAPKFPMPNILEYFLKVHYHHQDPRVKDALEVSLNQMAAGGIFDHIGGGFARYSVDPYWKVPHFEKMLYDNAQLLSLYAQAYGLFKKPEWAEVVHKTAQFIIREWTDQSGGFFSSYDADSEGEEGRFYVWDATVMKSILMNDYPVVAAFYSVVPEGNWEGKNILHKNTPPEQIIDSFLLENQAALHKIIDDANKKLFLEREKRTKPALDNKILASWNGLAVRGLVEAYKYTGHTEYLEAALQAARFIRKELIKRGNRMDRNFTRGKSSINAFLEDYATVIQAFIHIYEVTLDHEWLVISKGLLEYSIEHFYDEAENLFRLTNKNDPPLVASRIDVYDNVIPSYNSMMAHNLFMMGTLFDQKGWLSMSEVMMDKVLNLILNSRQPSYLSNWCQYLIDQVYSPFEVVITGDNARDMLADMQSIFTPDVIFSGGSDEKLPLHQYKKVEGETTIYVCVNKTCKFPVREVEKARKLMVR